MLRSQTSTSEKIFTKVANGSQKAPATIGNRCCNRVYPACDRTYPAMRNIPVSAPSFMRARGVAERAGHSARCTSGCASHSGDSSLHSPWGVHAHVPCRHAHVNVHVGYMVVPSFCTDTLSIHPHPSVNPPSTHPHTDMCAHRPLVGAPWVAKLQQLEAAHLTGQMSWYACVRELVRKFAHVKQGRAGNRSPATLCRRGCNHMQQRLQPY